MPFYYISKTHSVPGYLKLRFGETSARLRPFSFAFMTVLMSGINMYSMALVMKVVLGWDIHFSIWVSSVTVAIYVVLGGLLSAIFNEVLQFVLIWLGALLIPILGLIEAGGWNGMVAEDRAERIRARIHAPVGTLGCIQRQPHGHPLDRNCIRAGRDDLLRLLDDRFPGGAAGAGRQGSAVRQDGSHHRRGLQDGGAVHRDSAGIAGLAVLAVRGWWAKAGAMATGGAQL